MKKPRVCRRRKGPIRQLEALESRMLLTGFVNITDKLDDHRPGGFSGVAWFDYNNDGWDDLFSNGLEIGSAALYRNEGDGSFTNVADEAGIAEFAGYSGANAGDIDNDGFTDLILVGRDQQLFADVNPAIVVLRNMGDGTFRDVTETAGVAPPETPGAAALADVDRDGDIDLFVTATGDLPHNLQHASKFYRNNGDFTFTDVTEAAGLSGAGPWACVAGFTDYDNDADSDLLVANCNQPGPMRTPIQLFQNDGAGYFTDVSRESRITPTGFWMGFAFADYNNDGNIDFHVTNAGTEANGCCPHALLQNNGDGTFTDRASRVGASTGPFGWGNSAADFNNDGLADLLYIGTLSTKQVNIGAEFTGQLGNPGTLLFNTLGDLDARRSFTDASDQLGIDQSDTFSAGLATSDFDKNGTVDVFIPGLSIESKVNLDETVPRSVLLQNTLGEDHHWVGVSLTGTVSNRDAIGARITVTAGDLVQTREVYGGSSFLSTDSFSQRFGLGGFDGTPEITVRWPNGVEEVFRSESALDSVLELVEGEGELPETSGTERLDGDANEDGQVDFADFLIVSENFGQPNRDWPSGDFDGDGLTGFKDFLILSANFGQKLELAPAFQLGTPVHLGAAVNTSDWEFGLDLSADGNTMYFNRCNFGTLDCDLYSSSRDADGTWQSASPVGSVNSTAAEVGPTITADGLELYFSDEIGPPNVIGQFRPDSRNGDIWVARRDSIDDDWGPVEPVSALNTSEVETYPKVSGNGLTLHFSRGNTGQTFVATRTSRLEHFGNPVALGPPISISSAGAAGIEFSQDERTALFVSYRPGGAGESDIWMATRNSVEDPWNEPVNLEVLNDDGFNGFPNLSPDGKTLYFVSTRPGGRGGLDIWSVDVLS